MITLLRAPDSWHASLTAAMSSRTSVVQAGLERADVDHHVDLAGAVADDLARLVGLDLRRSWPRTGSR